MSLIFRARNGGHLAWPRLYAYPIRSVILVPTVENLLYLTLLDFFFLCLITSKLASTSECFCFLHFFLPFFSRSSNPSFWPKSLNNICSGFLVLRPLLNFWGFSDFPLGKYSLSSSCWRNFFFFFIFEPLQWIFGKAGVCFLLLFVILLIPFHWFFWELCMIYCIFHVRFFSL